MSEASGPGSRWVVGIDLGTTNTALAWVDTAAAGADGATAPIRTFDVAQLTAPGTVEERSLLPSFLWIPRPGELSPESLRLPWGDVDAVAGALAARRAAELPGEVVASAKSWLCHPGVDRMARILPWLGAGAEGEGDPALRRSPVEASTAYLAHLRDAWNHAHAALGPEARLEAQEIYVTVPASFDAAARELTRRAAAAAGLERVHLLEEPQAAVYAWVEASGDAWRDQVKVGDLLLVCDVGGGTTDLSLVLVAEEAGELALRRIAVGDHVLLGGDNMDLALAVHVRERLARSGTRLDAWQFRGLVIACRDAKEALLGAEPPESAPLVVLGRGKKLVGGTVKTDLALAEVRELLLEGFFPRVAADAHAASERGAGLAEIGLPFASDPAVTRHLATFLAAHADAAREQSSSAEATGLPTLLLFNGGVMRADALRARVSEVLGQWSTGAGGAPPRVLEGTDLEHAVARGAAYYGLARRGRGVRIRGGTARSYYVGVASAMPAVPGHPPPVKAVCVVPFGVEEGSRLDVPGTEFGLLVGQVATFRFFASSTRRDDPAGRVLDEWESAELEELTPLRVELDGDSGGRVPVRLAAHVTEIGTLELWFAPPGQGERWRLELSVREGGARA
jgi:hypothetical protein